MNDQKKVALITGARGIGKTVALGLAKEGYRICLLSRTQSSLLKAAKEIKEHTDELLTYECDVSDLRSVNHVIDDVIKKYKHIDVLFNNAGILRDGTLENVEDFNDMINVNLIGAFNILHAVVPHMKKRQQGYIFNLASICGKIGYAGVGAYTASKFGLVGLSESLFHELAPSRVKVTAICPSYVATDMVSHVEFPPQNLMIEPEDIWQLVKGLLQLSPEACVKEMVVYCRSIIN